MLLKTLYDGGFIHGECMTVTGKTIKENLDELAIAEIPDQQIVKPVEQPIHQVGTAVILKGTLAPEEIKVKPELIKR